jgi:RNA polymerase sigma-70 factor (ECF subfamily)
MPIFAKRPGLLRPFSEGVPSALEEVYWFYKDKIEGIVRFGTRRVPTTAEIEDLIQEIFTKAFAPRARRAFDGQRPYGPYLFAIARNLLRRWSHDMMREVPTDWPALCEWLEQVEATEPPTHADPRMMAVVERFVSTLPPDLRAVHEQRFVRGLSQRDAAEILGIGRQSVRTLEGRLRDELRGALLAEGLEVDGSNEAPAVTDRDRMAGEAAPHPRRGVGRPS